MTGVPTGQMPLWNWLKITGILIRTVINQLQHPPIQFLEVNYDFR
jgi:hypothetical protein